MAKDCAEIPAGKNRKKHDAVIHAVKNGKIDGETVQTDILEPLLAIDIFYMKVRDEYFIKKTLTGLAHTCG